MPIEHRQAAEMAKAKSKRIRPGYEMSPTGKVQP